MEIDSDLKHQRDRFLAFSFAGADLLLEINESGKITFVIGAIKSLLGLDESEILKIPFLNLFSDKDRELMSVIQKLTKTALKQGPYLVTMESPKDKSRTKIVFVSGFKMSPDGHISVAISQGDGLLKMAGLQEDKQDHKPILDINNFESRTHKVISDRIARGKDTNIQLIELSNIADYKNNIGERSWADFMSAMGQVLMTSSLDGESAVQVDDGKYMLLNEAKQPDAMLQEKIQSLAKSFDINIPLSINSKDMVADPNALNAREATRAIMYTLKKLENAGIEHTQENLKESFGDFLRENANKISQLKQIVSHQEFNIVFQPIVNLISRETSHHEVLMRFNRDDSPYELIVMGEEVGIAPDIDLSVCRRAIKYIDMNAHRKIGNLAVNISGASIQNDAFLNKLLSTLKEYHKASRQIIFEITESSEIKNFEKVNAFIKQLRQSGHPVCLDDFGAGAASFQYLQKLEVDGIKIDGSYVKTLLTTPRDATMVKNITKMCHEMDVYVVAEMIENKEQYEYLKAMGVDKGQGWLFSKAVAEIL